MAAKFGRLVKFIRKSDLVMVVSVAFYFNKAETGNCIELFRCRDRFFKKIGDLQLAALEEIDALFLVLYERISQYCCNSYFQVLNNCIAASTVVVIRIFNSKLFMRLEHSHVVQKRKINVLDFYFTFTTHQSEKN